MIIIKLYFYIRSVNNDIVNFDKFTEVYNMKESIHYLKCNNIDIEYTNGIYQMLSLMIKGFLWDLKRLVVENML